MIVSIRIVTDRSFENTGTARFPNRNPAFASSQPILATGECLSDYDSLETTNDDSPNDGQAN
jgi:hypothetical protein